MAIATTKIERNPRRTAGTTEQGMGHKGPKDVAIGHSTRLVTLREAILSENSKPEAFKEFDDKWLLFGDEPGSLKTLGYHKINQRDGTLEAVTEKEWGALPFSQRAYVLRGKQPVSRFVFRNGPHYSHLVVDIASSNAAASVVVIVQEAQDSRAADKNIRTEPVAKARIEEDVKVSRSTVQLKALHRGSAEELYHITNVFGPDNLPNTRALIEELSGGLRMEEIKE